MSRRSIRRSPNYPRLTTSPLLIAWLVALAMFATGCGSSSSPTAPGSAVAAQAPASTTTTSTVTGTPTPTAVIPLTVAQVEMLAGAIQDEYHAEAVYQGVLADLGQVFPFVNIVRAEQNHAASLAQIYVSRGLTPPTSAWNLSNVPHFRTLAEACGASADAEIANIELYDRYLASELPTDLRNVFTNNRAASAIGHLPAFTRCK